MAPKLHRCRRIKTGGSKIQRKRNEMNDSIRRTIDAPGTNNKKYERAMFGGHFTEEMIASQALFHPLARPFGNRIQMPDPSPKNVHPYRSVDQNDAEKRRELNLFLAFEASDRGARPS
jgi:hypothetical protein